MSVSRATIEYVTAVSKHGRPGYRLHMTETPKDVVEEAQRGRSERTPWLALTGVTLVVAVVVAVIAVAALIVYFVV